MQIFSPPSETETYDIAKMLIAAQNKIQEITGQTMTWSLSGLDLIQGVLDSRAIRVDDTYSLQALGMAFGKIFVETVPDYDWWIVEDEYGKDVCLRYLATSLCVFPQTMISKRIEDGEEVNVGEMYHGLKKKLEEILLHDSPDN